MNTVNMGNCKTCIYWEQNTHFEEFINTGICGKLPDFQKMDINIDAGRGGVGVVESVETEEDFGCTLHEPSEFDIVRT